MKILILGGTGFVGRHIVEAMLVGGHAVTVLARGTTRDGLPAAVERVVGDRDLSDCGLGGIRGQEWDACIDVSGYTPRQVRASVEQLCMRVQRYVYVSAVRVYGDPSGGPIRETDQRMPPANESEVDVNDATYGALKVACEDIVLAAFADRCTLLRPQVVAGRHDSVDRLSYWVRRAMLGGEMLAPGDGSDYVQLIDACDVGRFARTAVESDLAGIFNLSGTRHTWAEFMRVLGAKDLVWVSADLIKSAGLTMTELPLYRPAGSARCGLMHVSNERAVNAGLRLTALATTVATVREWLNECGLAPALTPESESQLIRLATRAVHLPHVSPHQPKRT